MSSMMITSVEELRESIDHFVDPTLDKSEQSQALNGIILYVHQKKASLQLIVEFLGDYLVNPDELLRGRGTLLLSELLERLPQLPLDTPTLHFLVMFHADRLQDYSSIPEVLLGLRALLRHHSPAQEDVIVAAKSIFADVTVQSLGQAARQIVLDIFSLFLTKHLEGIKMMKSDFALGFLQAIDGEKDPRILMNAFRLVPTVVNDIPEWSRFAEDLFELLSCYFPITFKPKPDDPSAITKDDLVNSLRNAMASSPLFAEHCIPFLLDKFSSDVLETKIESLETLSHCCTSYGRNHLQKFTEDIWSSLRTEILTSKHKTIIDASLRSLVSIIGVLSPPGNEPDSILNAMLQPLIQQCMHEIHSPDVELAVSCAKILETAAKGSRSAFSAILQVSLPNFLSQYPKEDQPARQTMYLGHATNLIQAAETFYAKDGSFLPLAPFSKQLFDIFNLSFLGVDSPEIRSQSVKGLSSMIKLSLLSVEEVNGTIGRITQLLFDDEDPAIRTQCLKSLLECSETKYADALHAVAVPFLFSKIAQDGVSTDSRAASLKALSFLASNKRIFQTALVALLQMVETARSDHGSLEQSLFEALASVVRVGANQSESIAFALETAIPKLLGFLLKGMAQQNSKAMGASVFDHIHKVFRIVCQHLAPEEQAPFIQDFTSFFLHGKQAGVFTINFDISTFKPFDEHPSALQKQLHQIFQGVLICARKEVSIPHLSELLPWLMKGSQDEEASLSLSSSKCFASIINKTEDASILDNFLKKTLEELINGAFQPTDSSRRSLQMLIWTTKALVMRGHERARPLLEKLCSGLASDVGQAVAQAFGTIVGDDETALTKTCHATSKVLYKQKTFYSTLPSLLSGFANSDAQYKPNYLLALSLVMQHVPKSVITTELPKILPLLIQSLSSEFNSLRLSTLQSLSMLMEDATDLIGDHIAILLPLLLQVSTTDSLASSRMLALQCLQKLHQLPSALCDPYKAQVVQTLLKVLDDKKRVVRQEAAKARNVWYM